MLVSVLICSYNAAPTLSAALDSALRQDFPSDQYEVLLVDDGSTDETQDIADEYSDRFCNFRYVQFPANRGLVAACNYGIKSALGTYFIRLDADDRIDSDVLSYLIEPLEQGETDLAYCDRYEIDLETGSQTLVRIDPFDLFSLTACGTMLRTDLLRQILGYRNLFWEEYDLYIRYLQASQIPPVHIPRALYYYSRHPSSMTANPDNVRQGWKELSSLWGDDVLKSYGWPGLEQEAS